MSPLHRKGVMDGMYLVLLVWKSILALKGCATFWAYWPLVAQLEPVRLRHGRRWVLSYVLMQVVDELKSLLDREAWSSHWHHVVTGLGCGADWRWGSERTIALTVMMFTTEIVRAGQKMRVGGEERE